MSVEAKSKRTLNASKRVVVDPYVDLTLCNGSIRY